MAGWQHAGYVTEPTDSSAQILTGSESFFYSLVTLGEFRFFKAKYTLQLLKIYYMQFCPVSPCVFQTAGSLARQPVLSFLTPTSSPNRHCSNFHCSLKQLMLSPMSYLSCHSGRTPVVSTIPSLALVWRKVGPLMQLSHRQHWGLLLWRHIIWNQIFLQASDTAAHRNAPQIFKRRMLEQGKQVSNMPCVHITCFLKVLQFPVELPKTVAIEQMTIKSCHLQGHGYILIWCFGAFLFGAMSWVCTAHVWMTETSTSKLDPNTS